ncbi:MULTISPECIES: (R)-mandelonitrile lyase [Flavobacterium]|jgi:quercetin dioxygenase-like cupin family protein|uniref:Cupin n=1 Tax=Flavobacterium tructae TaxID=1114873 RepID=A0A1S1J1F8_9FLAO|nr:MULTISPECIES: cupin domain-containing protein [Flavobacterium]OHT43501.1 cupin [Flavobacterium tructae]OXB17290.1 cupin [Flavobacterium tructae]URC11235.1 cupin domain-containing protein [Flavobacterium sp. B183]
MSTTENQIAKTIFPKGDLASSDYFTGKAWVKMLVPNDPVLNTAVGNVVFEAGARNNWHTHPGGQILIVTQGKGFYQEEGKSVQLLQEGDVVNIQPEVKHWHGASPDSEFTHIAISTCTEKGIVDWLEPVTDEQYNSFK